MRFRKEFEKHSCESIEEALQFADKIICNVCGKSFLDRLDLESHICNEPEVKAESAHFDYKNGEFQYEDDD